MPAIQGDITAFVFRERHPYAVEDFQRARIRIRYDDELGASVDEETRGGDGEQAPESSLERTRKVIEYLQKLQIGDSFVLSPCKQREKAVASASRFQFTYVGLLSVSGYLFIVLPKYYQDITSDVLHGHGERILQEFPVILQTIRKYNNDPKHNGEMSGFAYAIDDNSGYDNVIELYRFLLEDYAEHGPYRSVRRMYEHNGSGEIDWNRTVHQMLPMYSDGAPVYTDFISMRSTADISTAISDIQQAMVSDISRRLTDSGIGELLQLPLSEPSKATLSDLGDFDVIRRILRKELRVQFVTRNRLLLQAMLRYLDGSAPGRILPMLAEGTCSFQLVWEDVCKVVFDDDERLHGTQPPRWEFDDPLDWCSGHTTRKRWLCDRASDADDVDVSEDSSEAEGSPLLPDVVTSNVDGSQLYILDAKYYVPKYSKPKKDASGDKNDLRRTTASIAHAPGLKDIVKQYFYLLALLPQENHDFDNVDDAESAEDSGAALNLTIAGNAFVMPGQIPIVIDGEDETLSAGDSLVPSGRRMVVARGCVYFPFMNQRLARLHGNGTPSAIMLFELDPEQALRWYLRGKDSARSQKLLKNMFGS
ncbi:LlaJI family restriction endonuclease [Bifidobacterium catulorum]|uniref:LlaJI family restriction endonuclease n=1 Tax=Bifidobacterium catulorum TaxID=1630173 RepID=A0A2U2MT34_9BIFI|nr:LlaJI family restriction endonuclease [Bifidobacterium catulorum]PWG60013.1 hypothetical protein DF200_04415 [Bifidobacterium catulorum]